MQFAEVAAEQITRLGHPFHGLLSLLFELRRLFPQFVDPGGQFLVILPQPLRLFRLFGDQPRLVPFPLLPVFEEPLAIRRDGLTDRSEPFDLPRQRRFPFGQPGISSIDFRAELQQFFVALANHLEPALPLRVHRGPEILDLLLAFADPQSQVVEFLRPLRQFFGTPPQVILKLQPGRFRFAERRFAETDRLAIGFQSFLQVHDLLDAGFENGRLLRDLMRPHIEFGLPGGQPGRFPRGQVPLPLEFFEFGLMERMLFGQ